ncbi:MAG: hypothetical protein HXS41_00225 [Theionarchaea archaeon]|nr:hypothetical protein [Theionarchaea archaeon]MBU7019456.1 hypothetical protein [Theionarchaea archaeon]
MTSSRGWPFEPFPGFDILVYVETEDQVVDVLVSYVHQVSCIGIEFQK